MQMSITCTGKKVIFDAHEDVPVQILGKPYLHPWIRQLLSKMYEKYAAHACQRLAGIVAATPYIEDKFLRVNSNSVNISNFPLPDEFVSPGAVQVKDRKQVCYLGGIGVSRGIREMIRALEMLESNTRLVLCGRFEDERVRRELETHAGWELVDDRGWLDRDAIRDVLLESAAGLVTLQPQQNYLDAYPIKMFEYMSAAVPVISSDFPLWREIVEGNDCGICVDPVQPQAIAEAIDYLVQNPLRAREMGENGRRAIENKYNWPAEESKLVEFYEQLFHGARK
jgi:glycosyltransferase involved in cell wall biosynthesis